ncbi:hypothetical protein, partial [Anaerosolibacter sp.]|uniref:hypothetical protein n=1 Tax=Anaerosolibacter sp. TaxID=1872527 RepID=UPI0039F0F235
VCRGDSPLPFSGRCSGCLAAVEGNLGFPSENKLPIGNFVSIVSKKTCKENPCSHNVCHKAVEYMERSFM